MTQTVIAGNVVILVARWELTSGGALTDLTTGPTIAITNVGTAAVALAATSSGVTHPATGVNGYAWATDDALPAGTYLAVWSGTYLGSPVSASEEIIILAAASAEAANTSPDGVWYCTREDVRRALDGVETHRSNLAIDRAIETGAREIEGPSQCARRFYPVDATRYFPWPERGVRQPSWRLDLDGHNELISVASVTNGDGSILAADEYLLEPINSGPPYTSIEIDLGSSGAFAAGSTSQRAIGIGGTYGYRQRWSTAGTAAEALDDTETALNVDGAASAALGVGSLLRIDSERLIVTGRALLTTGQTIQTTALTASLAGRSIAVTSGAAFSPGEELVIDAERLLVLDIIGNTIMVQRAYSGSVLAGHSIGATIYGYRTLTVTRGALGTVAAAHSDATDLYRFEYPPPVRTLNIAEAMNTLLNEGAGYARTAGTGESEREVWGRALVERRRMARMACGRKTFYRGAI